MPPSSHALRSRALPALALCGALAVPSSARADFEVTYLSTDSEGNALTNARLTANEMNSYVNLASCQCGERFGARIFLNQQVGTSYNASTRVRTYVGTSCSEAQQPVANFNPCVMLYDGLANEYDDLGLILEFEQVWLSSGTSGVNQAISTAEPLAPCEEGRTGTGQIWICVDNNNDSLCTQDEFISPTILNATGDTNAAPADPNNPGQPMASGVGYDYLEPQNAITGFETNAGDGKVVISWDSAEVNDIAGFRVLCSGQGDASPQGQWVTGIPTGQARTNGTLYYTANNVCGTPGGGGGDDSGPERNDGNGDSTGGGSTSGRGGSPGGSTDGGSAGGMESSGGRDTTDGGGTVEEIDCDAASSPLCSLDWAYVCSDHIPRNASQATVSGLRNDEPYDFMVVAYDSAGNPKIVSQIFTATPIETIDLWEQCEMQGDLCGNGGFCHCSAEPTHGAWLGVGLLLLGLARRRGRR